MEAGTEQKGLGREQRIHYAKFAKTQSGVSNLRGLFDFFLFWGLVAGACALMVTTQFHWAACIVAVLAIAKAQNGLLLMGHEAIHWIAFSNRRINEFTARYMMFGPAGVGLHRGRAAHLDHHRHLSTYSDEEIDLHTLRDQTRTTYLLHIFLPLLGQRVFGPLLGLFGKTHANTKYTLTKKEKREDLFGVIVSLAVTMGILFLVDWRLPIFWVGTLATVTACFHKMKAFCDHAKLPEESDEMLFSYRPTLLDRIFFGGQQARHAEHHHHPGVPYYNLGSLEEMARAHPTVLYRRGYIGFMIDYYRALGGRGAASSG